MRDLFDNDILCKDCQVKMVREDYLKKGFVFRSVICPECRQRIVHPLDEQKFHDFMVLKNKEFRMKMRLVGNSYAVSIPKEIVLFMREQEKIFNEFVSLCFEDIDKLSIKFGEDKNE